MRAEIEERQVAVGRRQALAHRLVDLDHLLAVLLQPDDVIGHRRERRRLDPRCGQPADRVDVVVGGQLAGAGLLEVGDLVLVGDVLALQRVIDVVAAGIARERGMRRVPDARLDPDVEHGLRDLVARRVVRQRVPRLVEVVRPGDFLGGAADELVGPLQVVVAVERLVHLVGERRLVVGIGAGRVEVLRRALAEGHEQRVRLLRSERMRVVRHLAAAGQRRRARRARRGRASAARLPRPVAVDIQGVFMGVGPAACRCPPCRVGTRRSDSLWRKAPFYSERGLVTCSFVVPRRTAVRRAATASRALRPPL